MLHLRGGLGLAQEAARKARSQKSLFFCQSRATTEAVAEHMRRAGTSVFVHHSAVSREERELAEESFADGLLEYPHYTRPQVWEGRAVPDVLLSGHHGRIGAWRQEQAQSITMSRRPDLVGTSRQR